MKLILPDKANPEFASLLSRKSFSFVWEIPNFFHKMQEIEDNPNQVIKCRISYEPQFLYPLKTRLYYSHETCCPCLQWCFEKPVDAAPPNIHYRIIVVLIDRRAIEDKRNHIAIYEPTHSDFNSNAWLQDPIEIPLTPRILNSDDIDMIPGNLTIVTFVEPLSVLHKFVTCEDGNLKWKCDNFNKKKEILVRKDVTYVASEYFYTNKTGYRMQLRMNIDFTHIYIFKCFLRGKYDNILEERIPFNTTVTIINQLHQDDESDHLTKKMLLSESIDMEYQIFELNEVENESFLKDDTLIINVIMEPI